MYRASRDKFFLSFGIFVGYLIGVFILNLFCTLNFKTKTVPIKHEPLKLPKPNRKTLYVGVMTAEKFLNNRATSCNSTWANHSKVEIEFYSQGGSIKSHGLSIVNLKGVNDSDYPPQRKSFRMLQHICRKKINDFDWFLRADDDAFFQIDKLLLFINSLDSERLIYLGQPGLGTAKKKDKLNLGNRAYCMGGPGVFFSRALLRQICPYLQLCLEEVQSEHEDVEVGRCVTRVANVECSQANEMRQLFYFNYFERSGSFTDNLDNHKKHILPSLSLHPIKNSSYMYRMHNFLLAEKSLQIRHKIHKLKEELKDDLNDELKKPLIWTSFDHRTLTTTKHKTPKRGVPVSWNSTTTEVLRQVFQILNANSSRRLFEAELIKLRNSYIRIHHKRIDYRLFIYYKILQTGKYIKSKNLALNFKRDLHDLEFKEISKEKQLYNFNQMIKLSLKKLKDRFTNIISFNNKIQLINCRRKDKTINIILPLAGRFKIFQRFMTDLSKKVLICKEEISLTVIYPKMQYDKDNSTDKVVQLINDYQTVFNHHTLRVILVDRTFNRAFYLQTGADIMSKNDFMCFMDVDLVFDDSTLWRFSQNSRRKEPYFPIFFAEYKKKKPTPDNGYWRDSSFGMLCTYKEDFDNVGGFNLSIVDWGKEDIDLYDRFVKANYQTMRSIDPELKHIFHPIKCDIANTEQRNMCLKVKVETITSTQQLAKTILTEYEIYNRMTKIHTLYNTSTPMT
ncbi:DgyrCDS610 [Dimorphilus gyrociliatus]|uniref:Hexosyltransferase n=1 Tax=Dimorphilus gyrociliatus TaxID=2664684 RepID=A0A7I8V576_9ANNE|nr:DgyrCDS610 [Dimorphilus gyrociliatus]